MKSLANKITVFAILLFFSCSDTKNFHSSSPSKSFSVAYSDVKPPPCECENKQCKGVTQCDKNQYSHCKCDASGEKCIGQCFSIPKNNVQFVVDVLVRITGENLTKETVTQRKSELLPIIFSLVSSGSEGHYKYLYRETMNNFSFVVEAAENLTKGAIQIEKS